MKSSVTLMDHRCFVLGHRKASEDFAQTPAGRQCSLFGMNDTAAIKSRMLPVLDRPQPPRGRRNSWRNESFIFAKTSALTLRKNRAYARFFRTRQNIRRTRRPALARHEWKEPEKGAICERSPA